MTVHEIDNDGKLTELLKATGGAYGGLGECSKLFHWSVEFGTNTITLDALHWGMVSTMTAM